MRALLLPLAGLAVQAIRRARTKGGCESLTDIVVNGEDFTEAAKFVCNAWPNGDAVVNSSERVTQLMDYASSTYDDLKSLSAERRESNTFCWKSLTKREVLSSRQGDCEMMRGRICYGDCPSGFKPTWLLGKFAPTCSSLCSATQKVACGFGCASSRRACGKTLTGQITEVLKAVGTIGSFMTGNKTFADTAAKIIQTADFIIGTLGKLLEKRRALLAQIGDTDEGAFAVATIVMQFVVEHAEETQQDWNDVKKQWKEATTMIVELLQSQLEWKRVNLKFLVETMADHGESVLDAAYDLSSAFVYPKCTEVPGSTVFTIEDAGDERLLGGWRESGTCSDRKKYTKDNLVLSWNEEQGVWHIHEEGSSVSLYVSNLDVPDFPTDSWQAYKGALPAPTVIAVAVKKRWWNIFR